MIALSLFIMIFLHIVDDYYLQGILAQLKQKKWWEENYPHDIYKEDYKTALKVHGFSWSFMIMLPTLVSIFYKGMTQDVKCVAVYVVLLLANMVVHSYIDNVKANKYIMSLSLDQSFHLLQIVISWIVVLALTPLFTW